MTTVLNAEKDSIEASYLVKLHSLWNYIYYWKGKIKFMARFVSDQINSVPLIRRRHFLKWQYIFRT